MTSIPFGPITVGLTPGTIGPLPYSNPQNALIYDSGQIGAISTLDVGATTHITGYNGTNSVLIALWYDDTDGLLGSTQSGGLGWDQSSPFSWSSTAPAGATRVQVGWAAAMASGGPWGSTSAVCTANGSIGYTATTFCQYGTRTKASTPQIIQLIPSAITAIVGAVTDGWAWPLASVFAGYTLDVNALCGGLPPIAPDLTPADFLAMAAYPPTPDSATAIGKGWQWMRAAAWKQYCECTPGALTPTPPPTTIVFTNPPAPGGGTTFQPPPVITCDQGDLCGAIANIQATNNAMSQTLAQIQNMVNLIQRQIAPFAYVAGTTHSGLSGQGTLDVADIIGISVQLTTIPSTLGADMEYPPSTFRFGDVSLGTADGWATRMHIEHNPHLILAVSGAITQIGYTFVPGVVANIVELVREA